MSQPLIFKVGDKVFEEGDQSKSAYFVKRGMIRIFKKKYDSTIEIETIRAGQLLGELAFLDNQPRSASAEAIVESELVEISQTILDDTLNKTPEWLKVLLKTITGRLRSSTNKIRTLENPSSDYETDKWGNRSKEFLFVSKNELMRFCSALLVAASRYGDVSIDGTKFPQGPFERMAVNVLQVNESKFVHLVELFKAVNLFKPGPSTDTKPSLLLTDIDFVDKFIWFMNEQNMTESSKQRILSPRGFLLLGLIMKHIHKGAKDKDGNMTLNIAPVISNEGKSLCNPPLRADEMQELVDQKFVNGITVTSADVVTVTFSHDKISFEFRVYWIVSELDKLNENKRKAR